MIIAISATGNSMDSMVDPRFGRAPWLLIVDSDSNQLIEAIDNTAGKAAAQGAGISAAALVADRGVKAVLTGRVGPKAMPVLEKAGVMAVNDVSGPVQDAVASFSRSGQKTTSTGEVSQEAAPAPCFGQGRGRGMGQGCGGGQGRGMGQGRGGCRR